MKNYLFAQLLFFSLIHAMGQGKGEVVIQGTILLDAMPLSDVHIINTRLQKGTITDPSGNFEMLVQENDSLYLSHVSIKAHYKKVTHLMIKEKKAQFLLQSSSVLLNEVQLKENRSIFYVAKDILPPKEVNAVTLGLPNAHRKPVSQATRILPKIRSGVVANFDGILSALFGANKEERKLKEVELETSQKKWLREQFSASFFKDELKINKDQLSLFLYYCVSKGIVKKSSSKLELTERLVTLSKKFRAIQLIGDIENIGIAKVQQKDSTH